MTQLAQALSQIAAPAVAGALMGLIGLLGITVIDLATFLVSTVLLVAASIPEVNRGSRERRSYWRDLPVGWRCISASSGLLALLLMFTGVNFFSELATVLYTPLVLQYNMRYLFCLSTTTTAAGETVFLGTSDDYDYNTNQGQNDQPTTPIQNGDTWSGGFAGTTGSNVVRKVDAATIGRN